MSALMDQIYDAEASSRPRTNSSDDEASAAAAHTRTAKTGRRLERALAICVSLAVGGAAIGLAIGRFGWAGALIATWPAIALAGAVGCACHELLLRSRRGRRGNPEPIRSPGRAGTA